MRALLIGTAVAVAVSACGGSAKTVTTTGARTANSPAPAARAATTSTASATSTAPARPRFVPDLPPGAQFGIGNVPDCLDGADPTPYLRQYSAALLRVVVSPTGAGVGSHGEAVHCLQAASAAGFKVHLVIQYRNVWGVERDAAYVQRVLSYYAPYAWAVSVGNEQELYQGGPPQAGAVYAADWRALEPIVAKLAPKAIRVAGEISPWGFNFLKGAVVAGLPGAQAIAAHVYSYPYHFQIGEFDAWCHSVGLPCWFTEGAYIPGSHAPVVAFSQLAGAPVIESWLGY